jgi:hypothetical protein
VKTLLKLTWKKLRKGKLYDLATNYSGRSRETICKDLM